MTTLPPATDFTDASVTEGAFKAAITALREFIDEWLGTDSANGPLMQKGADIASASPLVIGLDGDYFNVTGTTGFAAMTVAANRRFFLQFDAILTMTHHATNLDLPGEADITTAAGDVGEFFSTGASTVQCVNYTRANGAPIIPPGAPGNALISDGDNWVSLVPKVAVNTQANPTYTTVLGDANTIVQLVNASAIALTIPSNASVPYPIGATIAFTQLDAGLVTMSGAGGVTLRSRSGLKSGGQFAMWTIIKTNTDVWSVAGDLTT